jgi:DNA-binding response OmpR family regulator
MPPRRVLVVDDNIELAENIAEILEMEGFLAEVAASVEDALKPSRIAPDVLVTDYRMPRMSGVELVRQFRVTHGPLRALIISAYTDEQTIKDATDAGAGFLAKPIDFQHLRRFILE